MQAELGGVPLRGVHEDCPACADGGKPRADARMTSSGELNTCLLRCWKNLAQMRGGACLFRHRLVERLGLVAADLASASPGLGYALRQAQNAFSAWFVNTFFDGGRLPLALSRDHVHARANEPPTASCRSACTRRTCGLRSLSPAVAACARRAPEGREEFIILTTLAPPSPA